MNPFWKSETWAIVKAMRASGNRQGLIATWKDQVEQWARAHPGDPDAKSVLAWLPYWHVRPFYTAAELAPIWPALAIAIGHTDKWPKVVKSAARLENELDYAGLPFRLILDKKHYIVERLHYWKKAQKEEIENAMAQYQSDAERGEHYRKGNSSLGTDRAIG